MLIYVEELAYAVMEAEVCSWQDGDGRAVGAVKTKFKSLRARRTDGVCSSLRAARLETHKRAHVLSLKVEKNQCCSLSSQAGGVPSYSVFLFYSAL